MNKLLKLLGSVIGLLFCIALTGGAAAAVVDSLNNLSTIRGYILFSIVLAVLLACGYGIFFFGRFLLRAITRPSLDNKAKFQKN